MTDTILTKEQKRFLEECEEEFKDRYTEKDSSFMNIKMQESKKLPIMDPWYNKSRRYEHHDIKLIADAIIIGNIAIMIKMRNQNSIYDDKY
jgi:hypothetical protein